MKTQIKKSNRTRCLTLAALALLPLSASAGLLESYETAVPPLPDPNTSYVSAEQSSVAGVTQGTMSMKLVYNFSGTWQWLRTNYPAAAYADWHANDIILMDVHRPALTGPSKLNLAIAFNGPMGWKQPADLVSWKWLNAGASTTETIAFDYRTIRDAAPLPGAGLPDTNDYFQLNLMARSDMEVTPAGSGIGGEVYIDNIRFISFVTPPPVAFYTFDSDAEGFTHYTPGEGQPAEPELNYSNSYGGSLQLVAGTGDDATYHWHLAKTVNGGNPLDKLAACAARGGHISYDLIGPAGSLLGQGFSNVIQVHNTWKWTQADHTVTADEITPIGDGNEIARITLDAAAFRPDLAENTGYNFFVGYNGTRGYHFDNLVFAPNPEGAQVTFDADEQNFSALGTSDVYGENEGLSITNPAEYQEGAVAIFAAGSGDPQVEAVYQKLLEAAAKGGVLQYKIKNVLVLGQTEIFEGLNIDTAFKDGAYYAQDYTWISKSDLTLGGDPQGDPPLPPEQTPAGFSRTAEVTLYPAGSSATDGFVLPANAASYEFQVKSGFSALEASDVTFLIDDFTVSVNADPEIVYTPPLPTGSDSFVGRALSNAESGGTWSATGLPPGIMIDPATGLIHGTPTTNGTYNVVFSVTRGGVTDTTDAMTWEITGAADGMNLVITSFSINGTTAVLNWSGAGATPVNVERSTSLGAGSWSIVSPNNTSGTFTDTAAPAGNAFYRLAVP